MGHQRTEFIAQAVPTRHPVQPLMLMGIGGPLLQFLQAMLGTVESFALQTIPFVILLPVVILTPQMESFMPLHGWPRVTQPKEMACCVQELRIQDLQLLEVL